MQIELNIRSLYLKYQKKFEKYIKLYISKISSEKELIKDYTIIRNKMDSIIKDDKNNLIYSFYQDKLNIDDYIPSKIDSIISKIYTDSSMINLYDVNTKLTNSLIEYKNYLKYINLIKKIKTLYKEEIEKDFLNKRLKQIDELIYFTLNPSNTIITNLTIMDDNDIKEIIISNYRLFNVNLDSSTLESDIDNLINDLEKINIYHILNNFKIDILNLQSIKEGKKLLEKYNTQKDIE